MTDAERDAILELHAQGKTTAEIRAELSWSETAIRRVVRHAGKRWRLKGSGKRDPSIDLPWGSLSGERAEPDGAQTHPACSTLAGAWLWD